MTANQLTRRQGQALAAFIHTLRPDWDVPGIDAALGRARTLAPAADVATAAIRAAAAVRNRTPGVIPLEGPHWRGSQSTPQFRHQPRDLCSTCGKPEHECLRLYGPDDHAFAPPRTKPARGRKAALVAARTAVAEVLDGLCPHQASAEQCNRCRPAIEEI